MQLIFIHGSGGSKESWTYQTRYFKDSLALDLPGHPQGELLSSVEDYVEWLRNVIQSAGYRQVVLVGHSLGGGIALLYALKYPQDLAGIISVGSGARLRVHPMFLEGLEKVIKDPGAENPLTTTAFEQIDPELAAVLKRRSAENGPAAALNDLKACDQFDLMDRIAQIEVPTLALCGERDVMTPPKYSQYLATQMPKAKTLVIPGGTHMVFAEKPLEVNRAIEDFLKTLG
jgi:pimeloyl-ACP methyl ester carboxylesterase